MTKFLLLWKKRRRDKGLSKLTGHTISNKLKKLFALLILIIFLHALAISVFESLSFQDALWLSVTSITTVGYGDFSAATLEGRIATIVLIYVIGIWLLAQLVGDFIDFRVNRREQMIRGLWRWREMADHILIINTPSTHGDRYLVRLIAQIKQTPKLDSLPIEIATKEYPHGLPNDLRQMDVVHYHIDMSSVIHLEDLNIDAAKYIIVLSHDEADAGSDSFTLDVLDRLRQYDNHAYIVAESVLDENRQRFKRLGANGVIRPVRGYPELIVRALSAPGTERVLENLFTHQGASTQRFDIDISGKQWKEIACNIMVSGFGTPLGYVSTDNEIITNPNADMMIYARALLIMVSAEALSVDSIREVI